METAVQILGVLVVLIWLVACVVIDVRTHHLPLWMTLVPYLLGAVVAVFRGYWPAAILALVLIPVSDLPVTPRRLVFFILLVVGVLLSPGPDAQLVCGAVGFLWFIWDVQPLIFGGSDTRVLIALLLLAGDARLVIPLLAGMGLFGIIWKRIKGNPVPLSPGILAGAILYAGIQYSGYLLPR